MIFRRTGYLEKMGHFLCRTFAIFNLFSRSEAFFSLQLIFQSILPFVFHIIRSRDVISNPNCIEISISLRQKKLITE